MTLSRSAAGQSVTRTIIATDGGAATVVASGINIDSVRPVARVTGVRAGATYFATGPVAGCRATDSLSGVATCTVTRTTRGHQVAYVATATDRAGNRSSTRLVARTTSVAISGASMSRGHYVVHRGRTYTVLVAAAKRPTYLYAAPSPGRPAGGDIPFKRIGKNRWALGVTFDQSMQPPRLLEHRHPRRLPHHGHDRAGRALNRTDAGSNPPLTCGDSVPRGPRSCHPPTTASCPRPRSRALLEPGPRSFSTCGVPPITQPLRQGSVASLRSPRHSCSASPFECPGHATFRAVVPMIVDPLCAVVRRMGIRVLPSRSTGREATQSAVRTGVSSMAVIAVFMYLVLALGLAGIRGRHCLRDPSTADEGVTMVIGRSLRPMAT